MNTAQYETDRIKLVPNKELHITPCPGIIEHYGKVLTIETLYTHEIDNSQIEHIVNNEDDTIRDLHDNSISNVWVKCCYVESPTVPQEQLDSLEALYVPKNVYLRHTTLLR